MGALRPVLPLGSQVVEALEVADGFLEGSAIVAAR
jgi:hypothetical protein